MTVSRGAYVATAFAAMLALYLFRHYVRPTKLVMAAASTLAVVVLAVAGAYMLGFGDLIERRMLGNAASTSDLGNLSSGRTIVWAAIIKVMFEKPLSLLTGFGWNAYASMPFRNATHNHYLWAWFNLGLPGLVCSVLLLAVPVKVALSAARVATAAIRPHLIGFVVATTALAVALFFVNLTTTPWLYIWPYIGIVMRIAVNVAEQPVTAPASVRAATAPAGRGRDAHGWSAITSR